MEQVLLLMNLNQLTEDVKMIEKILQKRKTSQEIDKASLSGDLTGGYNFVSWLIYLRPLYLLASILGLCVGIAIFNVYLDLKEVVSLIASLYFGVAMPVIIIYLLKKEFSRKKQGKSQ